MHVPEFTLFLSSGLVPSAVPCSVARAVPRGIRLYRILISGIITITRIILKKVPARYRCKLYDECERTTHRSPPALGGSQAGRERGEGTTHLEVRLSHKNVMGTTRVAK